MKSVSQSTFQLMDLCVKVLEGLGFHKETCGVGGSGEKQASFKEALGPDHWDGTDEIPVQQALNKTPLLL